MKPFVIEVYSTDLKNSIRKARLESDSFESALITMESQSALNNVTRIVVSRRIGDKGQTSVMKVWTKSVAS